MKKHPARLLALIAIVAAVPVVLVAQEWTDRSGEDAGPRLVGGSGQEIPANAVEVVQAGPGATRVPPGGDEDDPIPLADSLRQVLTDVGGTVFTGPAELVVRGGVSFYVPAGAQAICTWLEDGSMSFRALTGFLYAGNRDLTLRIDVGGHVGASPTGRFTDLTGEGEARRGDQTVPFAGEGAFEDLRRAFADAAIFTEIPATNRPVSPSGAFR